MTDVEKFDRAVYAYLATISDKIVYAPTSYAIRTITKREKFSDNHPWNFISFFRDPSFDVEWNRMNNPDTVSGDLTKVYSRSDNNIGAQYVHSIPVNLSYQVDIWASKSVEVLEIATDLITKLYMQEQVIEVPINPDGEMGRFHLLDIEWRDNSDLERETEIGRIYRHTISFLIDARITMVREYVAPKFSNVPVEIYGEYEGEL